MKFPKNSFKSRLLSAFVVGIVASFMMLSAFALSRPRLVLFYTNWSARSRFAKPVVEQVVKSYNGKVDLVELDMDNNDIADQARKMGISIPATVPYLVIVDKNGKVISATSVAGESYDQLKNNVDMALGQ